MDSSSLGVRRSVRSRVANPSGAHSAAFAPAGAPIVTPLSGAAVEDVGRPALMPAAINVAAGFWVRAVAFSIDYVLILALQFLVGAIIGLGAALAGVTLTGSAIDSISLPLGLSMVIAYFTVFTGIYGRTPGKKVFNLEVVCTDGGRISSARAFSRTIAYALSSLFWGLGFVWAGFDARKQAWHDKVCGTLVVRSAGRG